MILYCFVKLLLAAKENTGTADFLLTAGILDFFSDNVYLNLCTEASTVPINLQKPTCLVATP